MNRDNYFSWALKAKVVLEAENLGPCLDDGCDEWTSEKGAFVIRFLCKE